MYVDSTSCNLSEYGIQQADIVQTFTDFLSSTTEQVMLASLVPGSGGFVDAATCLLKQKIGYKQQPKLSTVHAGSIVIVADRTNGEACASGGILVEHIAPEMYRTSEVGIALLCDYEENVELGHRLAVEASVGVVLLSPGCLQTLEHVSIICKLMAAQVRKEGPAVLSVSIPQFVFPSPTAIAGIAQLFPELNEARACSVPSLPLRVITAAGACSASELL